MHTWDWMLAEIRGCQFKIWHKLQAFKIRCGRRLPVTHWVVEQRLPFRFYLFKLSWWKSVQIINFQIRFSGGPNIQVSHNVVKSALEASWIEAYARQSGIQLSRSCRSSAESLSRYSLLRFTISSCSSIMEPEWHKLSQNAGNVWSEHTSWSKSSWLWLLIAQGCVSTVSMWWTPSSKG